MAEPFSTINIHLLVSKCKRFLDFFQKKIFEQTGLAAEAVRYRFIWVKSTFYNLYYENIIENRTAASQDVRANCGKAGKDVRPDAGKHKR